MPRSGSIVSDIVSYLRGRREGATVEEIHEAVTEMRGHALRHSVRSGLYAHLGDKGEKLFTRKPRQDGKGRGARYVLRGR